MNLFVKAKRKWKKLTVAFETALNYRAHRKLYKQNTVTTYEIPEGKYAIVNMDHHFKFDDFGRYFYLLCMYIAKAGFKVIIKLNMREFIGLHSGRYAELFSSHAFTYVRHTGRNENTVLLMQPGSYDRQIMFSYGYKLLKMDRAEFTAPYPMHPLQYHFNDDKVVSTEAIKHQRSIKILFAGKTRRDMYSKYRVKKYFDVLSRLEVLEFIKSNFPERLTLLQTEADKAVLDRLMNTDDFSSDILISEVKSDQKDWLKILSKADFFICPPGARMPWCHNSIEAMSVGSIPILEYGHLFHPELEHLKNCLAYSDYSDLARVLNMALSMDAKEIETLRRNVLDYYAKYLSVESVTTRIKRFFVSGNRTLSVSVPFIPTLEEAKAIPARAAT
jgi:hypothetical protein